MTKKSFRRARCALLCGVALLLCLASGMALATETGAAYVDENGQAQSANAKPLTGDTTTLESGWYYVTGTVKINQSLLISGDVKIILADGAHLEVITDAPGAAGIQVETGNSLTVYAQSSGEDMGKLTAQSTCTDFSEAGGGAGIGARGNTGTDANATDETKATDTRDAGVINLFGGDITATAVRGAGIGGGGGGGYSEGTSGTVSVSGSYAAGGAAGEITIAGNVVVNAQSQLGAGIGSGAGNTARDTGVIKILSGDVTAKSERGAGIGGGGGIEGWMKMGLKNDESAEALMVRGDGGNGGTIFIGGGDVKASSGSGAAIGGGGGADGSKGKDALSSLGTFFAQNVIGLLPGEYNRGYVGSPGGNGGSGGNITVTGDALIDAASIGGGNGGTGGVGGAGGVSVVEAVAGATGGQGGKGGASGELSLLGGSFRSNVTTGGGLGGQGGQGGEPGLLYFSVHVEVSKAMQREVAARIESDEQDTGSYEFSGQQGNSGASGASGATNSIIIAEGVVGLMPVKATVTVAKNTDSITLGWDAHQATSDALLRVVSNGGDVTATLAGDGASGSIAAQRPYAFYICDCEGEHTEDCLAAVAELSQEHPAWSIIHLSSHDTGSLSVDDTFGFWGVYGLTDAIPTTYAQCTAGCGAKGVNHAKKDCGHCVENTDINCGSFCPGCKKYMCNGVAHSKCGDCGEYLCVSDHAAKHESWLEATLPQSDTSSTAINDNDGGGAGSGSGNTGNGGNGNGTDTPTCEHDFTGTAAEPGNPDLYYTVCRKCDARQ